MARLPARARTRADEVPALLGALEQLRVALWARVVRARESAPREFPDNQVLTVSDVATELKFTPAYVYDAIRTGKLHAMRTGRYVRVRRSAVAAWLDADSPKAP